MPELDKLWTKYAGSAGILERRQSFRFDPDFYGARHTTLPRDPAELERHYREYGAAAGYTRNYYHEVRNYDPRIDAVLADLVIEPRLHEMIRSGERECHELAFELIHLGDPVDAEISNFSMKAYIELNPDIGKGRLDPLMHYLCHGVRETGRRSLRDIRESHHSGQRPFAADLPTCLIAVHEMSRTGAPVVGLDLVREAARTHNVIVAALRGGPLLEAFRELACDVVIVDQPHKQFPYLTGPAFERVDFAILNSVGSYPFVTMLVAREIPFVSYVHEYADYTFPVYDGSHPALFADLLVFSSDHVRASWEGRLQDFNFDIDRDSMVLPQRPLVNGSMPTAQVASARTRLSRQVGRDLTDVRLICGAGHLQWRKGTDIFAMTAQICRNRDPDTVFLWIGDGLNAEDLSFGVWMDYHLRQIGANRPDSNLFLLPAGPAYPDVLAASDAMFLSSRIDPLPNVVFDALANGCHVVLFDGGTGFGDAVYRNCNAFKTVEYANPEAASVALLSLPRKTAVSPADGESRVAQSPVLFERLRQDLHDRLASQRYFVRGESEIDLPILFTTQPGDRELRIREREKLMRYRRRMVWRNVAEAKMALATSGNWIHRQCRLAPYAAAQESAVPSFALHVHGFYTDDLAADAKARRAYRLAQRIVITTDTEKKADEIDRIMRAEGLKPNILLVPNRGRDILPFMELFAPGGAAGKDEVWCHIHQKRSVGSTRPGDVWRRFLLRILLGNDKEISEAITRIGDPGVGLVAPFEPHHVGWNASRSLLPRFADRLAGPLPVNPLVFPVGNMFWVRRPVVEAMNALFGPDYPWPNEPIANDGTEFHLIERLWPAMAAQCGLEAVFLHKLDEQRV